MTESAVAQMLLDDPLLSPYEPVIERRLAAIGEKAELLVREPGTLKGFASGHLYFGLHASPGGWVFREWAPNATAIYIVNDRTRWREADAFALSRVSDEGVWELRLPPDALSHGDPYRLSVRWDGGRGDRIPAWANRVVQDPETLIFNAQVWAPKEAYRWRHPRFVPPPGPVFIYEAHIGMAQDAEKVGSYREFTDNTLPRIAAAGYNTLQLMAIQEHPYYGSFGYQVSNFFAASSRYGPPEDFKRLVDTAHGMGLRVLMDLIHSHAVSNEVEGLSRFDGTDHQYFHSGARGHHGAWDSRCFDYGKYPVLHFLLSNCRYWLEEFHLDGYRFDGITSMLYLHHGLDHAFTSYADYFDASVDEDALVYLALANRLIHDVRPDAVTIAEDVSGMPGLALSAERGGFGFDFRFAMGVPDYWIRLTKDTRDEDWPIAHLFFELTNRRAEEKTISYAESHDQALVGDQTLIFRLVGSDMYHHMRIDDDHLAVARGTALHKLIRLATLATADGGYLNFMGNEFGHPEWIDFPREGNGWSYRYARRQWHLIDDPELRYGQLGRFDRDMIELVKSCRVLEDPTLRLLWEHNDDKVLVFIRAGLIFALNFHPYRSHTDYRFEAPPGKYRMIFSTDDATYGGHERLQAEVEHVTLSKGEEGGDTLSLYLPNRTGLILAPAAEAP